MLKALLTYAGAPPEIKGRKVKDTYIGNRRFIDLDVQSTDGAWHRRRLYIRAQPSRRIFKCDIPFKERPAGEASEASRDRLPVLIAPLLSYGVRDLLEERGILWWRNLVVWKPRLHPQENKTKCEISANRMVAIKDLLKLVHWYFNMIAAAIRRAWWIPESQKKRKTSGITLASFMRPQPWPPPGS